MFILHHGLHEKSGEGRVVGGWMNGWVSGCVGGLAVPSPPSSIIPTNLTHSLALLPPTNWWTLGQLSDQVGRDTLVTSTWRRSPLLLLHLYSFPFEFLLHCSFVSSLPLHHFIFSASLYSSFPLSIPQLSLSISPLSTLPTFPFLFLSPSLFFSCDIPFIVLFFVLYLPILCNSFFSSFLR